MAYGADQAECIFAFRKASAAALPLCTDPPPSPFDDRPAKQIGGHGEFVVAGDVVPGINRPPSLPKVAVISHAEHICDRLHQRQRGF